MMMKIKNDKILLFTTNKLHQNITFIIIILNLLSTLLPIEQMQFNSRLFFFVMYNILATLFYFLAATQVKIYQKSGSITLIVLGALQLLRIIFIPDIDLYIFTLILFAVSGLGSIAVGILSLLVSKRREIASEGQVVYNG